MTRSAHHPPATHRRDPSRRWRAVARCAALSLALCLGFAPARATAVVALPSLATATDLQLSRAVGACLSREDPGCAAPWLAELAQRVPGSLTLRYARGHVAFLTGEFDRAAELLGPIGTSPVAPRAIRPQARALAESAKASAAATRGFVATLVAGGRFRVFVQPGPDEVLVPLLDHVLSRAADDLTARLGPLPKAPVAVHVYPRVETLSRVSGLTEAQVRTSGTIALCKHNRLMITSPRDLVFGYHWADTVAHELVHYLVTKRGGADVPVWLHEAMARSLEATWRQSTPLALDADELALLVQARRTRSFVTLKRMHPTMAALPSQRAAQTAFAEVHHALLWLLEQARVRDPSARLSHLVEAIGAGAAPLAAVRSWAGTPRFPRDWWQALHQVSLARVAAPHAKAPGGQAAKRRRGLRGALRFRRGQRAARVALTKAAARYVELGDRLLAIDRPLAAVLEYRKAQAAGAPDDAMMLTRLARGLVRLGRHGEARVVLDDALTRHAHHAPLLLLRGQVALAQAEPKAALRWAQATCWINPFDPDVHQLRAEAHGLLGDTKAAAAARLDVRTVAR